MNFINSWSSKTKQNDKLNITVRFGKVTLIEIVYDVSEKKLRLMVLNIGCEFGGNKKSDNK